MKKKILLALMCLSIVGLAACGGDVVSGGDELDQTNVSETEGSQNSDVGVQTLEVNEWGLTLHAEDVTSKGMTIVCTQSGGSPTGELNTGTYYILERSESGAWVAIDYVQDMEVCWDAVAWMIPLGDTVEWEVDWEWLYGSLPAGHYRIGKEIMDFRGTGDYDKEVYYAEFMID